MYIFKQLSRKISSFGSSRRTVVKTGHNTPVKTKYTQSSYCNWILDNPTCRRNKSKQFESERLTIDLRYCEPESKKLSDSTVQGSTSKLFENDSIDRLQKSFREINSTEFNRLGDSRAALSHIARSINMIETLHGSKVPKGGTQLIYGNNGYMSTFDPIPDKEQTEAKGPGWRMACRQLKHVTPSEDEFKPDDQPQGIFSVETGDESKLIARYRDFKPIPESGSDNSRPNITTPDRSNPSDTPRSSTNIRLPSKEELIMQKKIEETCKNKWSGIRLASAQEMKNIGFSSQSNPDQFIGIEYIHGIDHVSIIPPKSTTRKSNTITNSKNSKASRSGGSTQWIAEIRPSFFTEILDLGWRSLQYGSTVTGGA